MILEGPPLDAPGLPAPETMSGFLRDVSSHHAHNEALVFDDPLRDGATSRWTYADLLAHSELIGRALVGAGVEAGAPVGIVMGNRPEAVASVFGAALAGAVAVPLSTFSAPAELAFMQQDAGITYLLVQSHLLRRELAEEVAGACPGVPGAVVGIASGPGPGGLSAWDDFIASADAVPTDELRARSEAVDPGDPGVIIYSSGTTAHPKGMVHSHRAHTLQFRLEADIFGRGPTTRLWTALPMFWTAGFDTAMGPTLASGGCWVMQETFEPGQALAFMARERVTEPYTLPHQTAALEEHPDWASADLSSLRCVFGKSAFARHPRVDGDRSWNMPVAYGLSETCSSFASHRHDTERELLRSSMGRLLAGNRLRVVDPETGAALGPGQDGELTVAGPTLMLHYVGKDPADCFDADGFFHTGDAGFYDANGYLHWTGRRTEMIKTAGANVSPAELEVQLRACPPVKLARVIGVPDTRLGQAVVLCAVLKEGAEATADDLRGFLRERVASYKVPRHVLFFSDGEVPMTGSENKVRDAELMRLVEDRLTRNGMGATT